MSSRTSHQMVQRTAEFFASDFGRFKNPETCPALVLNADYRPLSYYPLSLWGWQDTLKAVFMERVNVVSEYETKVHSPTTEIFLPSVVSLKTYVKPPKYPAFTRFNVFFCVMALLANIVVQARI